MMEKIEELKVVDLFAGGGGLSFGFMQAGFNVVASFDNWKQAIEIYRKNFCHPAICCDLGDISSSVEAIAKYAPDIIIGGPPCQDFSSAGKRDESGGRANLTLAFAHIIKAISPAYFVMENVDRAEKSMTFTVAKKIFSEAGYGLTVQILDASLCGVPQRRKRLFVIGVKDDPDDCMFSLLNENLATKPMTIREYLGARIGVDHYYRHPRSYRRRAIFSIDEPSPTIRGINRPVPNGYPGHPGDPVKISDTIRPLNSQERAMIQTFPDNYILEGSKTDIEQIIGNAVPVKLGKFVAKALKKYILLRKNNKTIPYVLSEKKEKYKNGCRKIASTKMKKIE